MFIKGNCAIYIDKNLKVYENSTVLLFCAFNKEHHYITMALIDEFSEWNSSHIIEENILKALWNETKNESVTLIL